MYIRGRNTVVTVFVRLSVLEHLIASAIFLPICLPLTQITGFFEFQSPCRKLFFSTFFAVLDAFQVSYYAVAMFFIPLIFHQQNNEGYTL